MIHTEQLPCWR